MGELGGVAVGSEVAPAGLPVRQIGAGLLPVDERGLIAVMVQPPADTQVRLAVHKGLHQVAFLPSTDAPPGVVRVGERVCAEVALGLYRLVDGGDGVGE